VRTRSDGGPAQASHLIWGVRRDSRRRIVDALRPNWRTAMSSISRTANIVATALAFTGLVGQLVKSLRDEADPVT
jgi:hypothetical protein